MNNISILEKKVEFLLGFIHDMINDNIQAEKVGYINEVTREGRERWEEYLQNKE